MNRRKQKSIFSLIAALFIICFSTGCMNTSTKEVGGNASGKVYDSNGKALHNAVITVYGTSNSCSSDEYGKYYLSGIKPGKSNLIATYENNSVTKVVNIKRGETSENEDIKFKVQDGLPPIITDVKIFDITDESVTISWVTNEEATSIIEYATGPVGLNTYDLSVSNTGLETKHELMIQDLKPGQIYHFRAKSKDVQGNEGVSSDYQFTTERGEAPHVPFNLAAAATPLQGSVKLTWTPNTDGDLDVYTIYRSDDPAETYERVADVKATEPCVYEDKGLPVAVKFYYKVSAKDTAGNESPQSRPVSISTAGVLAENRTLTKVNSPYIFYGDVRVRSNYTLTVEPGTEVKFTMENIVPDVQSSGQPALIVQGSLYAVGTKEEPIIFTSAHSSPRMGSWKGISFINTSEAGNIMKYASVIFADYGVSAEGSSPSVEYCTFSSCGVGMSAGLAVSLNIKYNNFLDCDIGLVSSGSNIRNNIFTGNQIGALLMGYDNFEYNTVDDLVGVQITSGKPIIKNNIIARVSSASGGIYGINQESDEAIPAIGYNNIFNYMTPFNKVNTATDTANIFTDPNFEGGFPYSYKLKEDSPAKKASEDQKELGRYGGIE